MKPSPKSSVQSVLVITNYMTNTNKKKSTTEETNENDALLAPAHSKWHLDHSSSVWNELTK